MERLILMPGEGAPPDVPDILRCMFNPSELVLTQAARLRPRPAPLWGETATLAHAAPPHATLELRLLFESGPQMDVRQATRALHGLAAPGPAGGAVPVDVIWGKHWAFRGTISRLSETLDQFTTAGIALRSWLSVELVGLHIRGHGDTLRAGRVGA